MSIEIHDTFPTRRSDVNLLFYLSDLGTAEQSNSRRDRRSERKLHGIHHPGNDRAGP